MLVKRRPGFQLPEHEATPEALYRSRRDVLRGLGLGTIAAGGALAGFGGFAAAAAPEPDPSVGLYPRPQNPRYKLDRPVTPEKLVTSYNNFYEYGSQKQIAGAAQALRIRPWMVQFDGMVEKPMTVDIDTLLKMMPLEERVYRHRCVEAWSMAVPWTGFALKALVDYAKPLSSAKYLVMETFKDASMASGQRQFWYPWPYREGLTMAEATNEVAFIATGLYGKPIPRQNGAPLRLAVPWKYGFKSIKSIVRFNFTDQRPKTFWETIEAREYGFWANVNPAVPHPRWSQATERPLGSDERVPTLIYNGYGEYVAGIYSGMTGERLFS